VEATNVLSYETAKQLPFCYQLINFLKTYFKKLAYIYYNKCFLWRYLCWVWKKNPTKHWFSYFQISYKYL